MIISRQDSISRIRDGAVGVLPTDTVYGVVARADDEAAVTRLYHLKHRISKPGTLIAASIEQCVELGVPKRYLTAVSQFWPNQISVIVPIDNPDLRYLDQGMGSLAIRLPNDAQLTNLLQQTGPLMSTSANVPGEPPAINLAAAQTYFADTVDFYVDGGDLAGHKPSTIIKIIDDAIEIVRLGAVTIDETGRITS